MADRWTREESLAVFSGVGSYGWSGLMSRTIGRSAEAVRLRIRRMSCGGVTRGTYTLNQLVITTGYNRSQLRRAQSALNQKWARMGKRGAHIITDDQAQDIIEWLKHDFWNIKRRLYGCIWCSTSDRPHRSSGLCTRCAHRYRRRCLELGLPTSLKEQKQLVADIILDCANRAAHGKILEEARKQLNEGLALTERLLDWVVTVHETNFGIDS